MELSKSGSSLPPEERLYIETLTKDMNDNEKIRFLVNYKNMRKNSMTFMLLTLVNIIGLGGLQRFYVRDFLIGLFFFLTLGLFGLGSLYDLLTVKRQILRGNISLADELYQKYSHTNNLETTEQLNINSTYID